MEFDTKYGHGIIAPNHGDPSQSITCWFVRPDGLLILVGVSHGQSDHTEPATLLLDEKGVQNLAEAIAAMIEMGSAATTSTSLATATTSGQVPSAEVQGYLDLLESTWEAAGIPVLGVVTSYVDTTIESLVGANTKNDDVLPYVALEVPASVFASSDYLFTDENIMRQTMVAIRDGVPLRYLGVVEVFNDGTKREWSNSEVFQLAQDADDEWGRPAKLALDVTIDGLRQAAEQAAKTAGVKLESFEVKEDASGRVVTVVGSVPDRDTVSAPVKWFSVPPEDAAYRLNKQGAKISGLEVKVDDLKGRPVLRRVVSFNVGGGESARWVAPELEAVQNQ